MREPVVLVLQTSRLEPYLTANARCLRFSRLEAIMNTRPGTHTDSRALQIRLRSTYRLKDGYRSSIHLQFSDCRASLARPTSRVPAAICALGSSTGAPHEECYSLALPANHGLSQSLSDREMRLSFGTVDRAVELHSSRM